MFDQDTLNVAYVVAHPDDEVLIAGGSLARHAAEGHAVHGLILARGLDSRGDASSSDHARLHADASRAAREMGIDADPQLADFPDNAMDSIPLLDIVRTVEAFVADRAPDVIYTHHSHDLNIDHRLTFQAVVTACRPIAGSTVRRILAGEALSSTEWQAESPLPFQPNVFHDISMSLNAKVAAMRAYENEIREFPHPRSVEAIRALAAVRGAQSGFPAAEAFMLVRECR